MSSLSYTARLEKLFIELREETVISSKQMKSTPGGSAPIVLLLPCFKPITIDSILNQSTNATNTTPAVISSPVEEEKENTKPVGRPNKDQSVIKKTTLDDSRFVNSTNRDYLNNEVSQSESVPIVRLMGTEKQPPAPEPQVITANFVFSPIAGRSSSFLSQQSSFSASKAESSNLVYCQPVDVVVMIYYKVKCGPTRLRNRNR